MPLKDPEARRKYHREDMRRRRQSKPKKTLMAAKAQVCEKTMRRWLAQSPFFNELISGCPLWYEIADIYAAAGREIPFKSWVPTDGWLAWCTVGEAAARIKVSETTLRRWLRAGKVAHVRHGEKGAIRIFADEVDRLKKCRV